MSFSDNDRRNQRFSMSSNFSLTSTNSGGSTISSMYSPQKDSIDIDIQEFSTASESYGNCSQDMENMTTSGSKRSTRLSFSGFPSLDHILSEINETDNEDFLRKNQTTKTIMQHNQNKRRFQSEQWKSRPSFLSEKRSTSYMQTHQHHRKGFGGHAFSTSSNRSQGSTFRRNSTNSSICGISTSSDVTVSGIDMHPTQVSIMSLPVTESSGFSSTSSSRSPLAPVDMNSIHSPREREECGRSMKVKTPIRKSLPGSNSHAILTPTSSAIVGITDIKIETPKIDASDLDVQSMIGDNELVSFCASVLRLLKQEIESGNEQGQRNMLKTLPKLRQAFNQLLECTDLPSWLLHKARDMKKQLEQDLKKGKCIKVIGGGKRTTALLENGDPFNDDNTIEEMEAKYRNEILLAREEASRKVEKEWRRKLSFGRKQAIQETTQKADAEKAGLVNFAKQCVKAIALLKEKIEKDKNSCLNFEQEKQKIAEQAAMEARKEAETRWARRLSMVRRETAKTTEEAVAQQFQKQHEEELRHIADRIRAEAEADWAMRLHEEQKNRRLSCQLKLTAAVERTNQRAIKERETALAALAEELEKEKEDATKAAAETARIATEQEWRLRYENEIQKARDMVSKEAQGTVLPQPRTSIAVESQQQRGTSEQSSGEGETSKQKTSTECTFQRQIPIGDCKSDNSACPKFGGNSSFEVKREESVWYGGGNGGGMRRYSIIEHPIRASDQMYPTEGKPISQAAGKRNLFRGLSQDFSMINNAQTLQLRAQTGVPIEKPKRVSFVVQNDKSNYKQELSTCTSLRDFSAEFALPSPIPIVSMPLDDTTYTPMVSRKLSMSFHNPRSSLRHVPIQHQQNQHQHIDDNCNQIETNQNKKLNETMLTVSGESNEDVIQFRIDDLCVKPGELQGSITSKYREYHITTKITVWKNGIEKQHTTQKTLRYSNARKTLLHDFERAIREVGVYMSFEALLASFPPKTVRHSNSISTAKLRALGLQTYILSACEICARLIDVCINDEQRSKIRSLLGLFFGDFL